MSSSVIHYWPDDHTLQVKTNLLWKDFLEATRPYSQGLPLFYPPHWTFDDVLSRDWPSVSTGLSGRYPRDYVLGIAMTDPQGIKTKAGGRVMKNVTGYDLCRLMVGSHNSLATLTNATLKLATLPKEFIGYWAECASQAEAMTLCNTMLHLYRDVLWACEVVSSMAESSLEQHQLFILSVQPLPADVFGGTSITILPHQEALFAAAQLSSFGWENNISHSSTQQHNNFFSGMIAVSVTTITTAFTRLRLWFAQKSYTHHKIQCRPAAGLLLFSVTATEPLPEKVLESLQSTFPELQTSPRQASLRFTQWSENLTSAVSALHLPALNTPEALYYKRLKRLYDPENILQSPHLPLHLLTQTTP